MPDITELVNSLMGPARNEFPGHEKGMETLKYMLADPSMAGATKDLIIPQQQRRLNWAANAWDEYRDGIGLPPPRIGPNTDPYEPTEYSMGRILHHLGEPGVVKGPGKGVFASEWVSEPDPSLWK